MFDLTTFSHSFKVCVKFSKLYKKIRDIHTFVHHIYIYAYKKKEKEIKRDNKKRIIENVIKKRFTYF